IKSLMILSVLVLMSVFLTLGCTGSDTASNSQMPSATTTEVIPDNSSIAPSNTSAVIGNDTQANNGSIVSTIAPADDLFNTTVNDNPSANITGDNGVMIPYNNTSIPAYDMPYNGST